MAFQRRGKTWHVSPSLVYLHFPKARLLHVSMGHRKPSEGDLEGQGKEQQGGFILKKSVKNILVLLLAGFSG